MLASFYPGVRVDELGMGVFRENGVPETNESSSSRFWDVGVILSQLLWCMKFNLDYLQQLKWLGSKELDPSCHVRNLSWCAVLLHTPWVLAHPLITD